MVPPYYCAVLDARSHDQGLDGAAPGLVAWAVPHVLDADPWRARESIPLPTLPRLVLDRAFELVTCLHDVWSGRLKLAQPSKDTLECFVTRCSAQRWLQTAEAIRQEQYVQVDESLWGRVLSVAAVLSSRRCPVKMGFLSGMPQGFLEGDSPLVQRRRGACVQFVLGQLEIYTLGDLLMDPRKSLVGRCLGLGVDFSRSSVSARELMECAYPGVTQGQQGQLVADPPCLWWMLEDKNFWQQGNGGSDVAFASAWVLRYEAKLLNERNGAVGLATDRKTTESELMDCYGRARLLEARRHSPMPKIDFSASSMIVSTVCDWS